MMNYNEHKIKLRGAAFHYKGLAEGTMNKNRERRFLRIREIAVIIQEHTQNRHGEIKSLRVPIFSKQSLVEKLKEHNINKGLSNSSLMPDIHELECYVGVRYVLADSDPKHSMARSGKYS